MSEVMLKTMSEATLKTMLKVVDLNHFLPNAKPDDSPLLNHLQCDIKAGESVAIVGASGSGKTTLLSFLAGLDTPSTGKVLIAGQDITVMNEEARAKVRAQQVAFVFQNFQLIDGLSALQNVCLPLEVKGQAKPEAQAIKWLERVGLGHRLGHNPTQLSGGEQQRVALARAFACGAPLLFADEPTGSLDIKTGNAIADLLFELCGHSNQADQADDIEHNSTAPNNTKASDNTKVSDNTKAPGNTKAAQTLILVTHDLTLAQRCDRILTLTDGQLVETVMLSTKSKGEQTGEAGH